MSPLIHHLFNSLIKFVPTLIICEIPYMSL